MKTGASTVDLLDRLLGHEAWTTRQLLLRCREVESELHRPFDAGHETVHATLVHMIGNVRTWTDLMRGRPVERTGSSWDNLTLADLIARHDTASADFGDLARWVRDGGRWDERWLDVLDDPPREKTYGGAIAHVITHNMQHRGELLHMLARLGVQDLLEGDALSWESAQASSG
jgi:uncharacterized damage-inducible protein DinB